MDDIKKSSNKSFGIVFFIVFLLISFYPLIHANEIRIWSLILSLIFLFLGIINSRMLTPLNKIWFNFGIFLGKIFTPIIMLVIFFTIVTPIAFFMRLFNKDLLNLKFNDNRSYWTKKSKEESSMKNQF